MVQCGCCGCDLNTIIYECDLCGKKTCENCMRMLSRMPNTFYFGPTTFIPKGTWNPGHSFSPQSQSTQPKSLNICVSCADLLKLSLRVASTQGYDIDRSSKE